LIDDLLLIIFLIKATDGSSIYKGELIVRISMRFIVFLSVLIYSINSFGEIRICATNEQIQSFCNTRKVRVVFIFNNKIHFIDFSEEKPKINSIASTSGAIMPVISPDGALVAYNSGISEDPPTNGNASIFVCPLTENAQPSMVIQGGFVPRFIYAENHPVLLYSTCGKPASDKVNVWDGCGKVMKKDLGSEEITTLFEGGSYYGGLSFDGRFLATAESTPNAFLLDLQNAQKGPSVLHSILVQNLETNDNVRLDLQTCNPSISSSRIFTNTMMYIDFSSSAIENAGCYHPVLGYWDVHQRIFIGRSDGAILRYYDAPQDMISEIPESEMGKGEASSVNWNHPEWSNHPYYATALTHVTRLWKKTMYERTYHNEGLYIINLKDSAYLKIVEITDTSFNSTETLKWPWVWIETPSNFAEIEDPNWLEKPISIKKRNYSKNLSAKLNIKNNLLQIDGDQIRQIRLFSHNGRLLWSRKYPNAQHAVILPSELVAGKLLIGNIALSSGRNISVPVSFLHR
jgi:hypothetical protein